VTEGLAQVYELLTSFVAMSGACALDGGLGTSVLHLLSFVLNDLIIRFGSVSGKAGLMLGRILRSLQGKQVLPGPSKQRSGDQNCKGEGEDRSQAWQAHLSNRFVSVVRF
jgi:hypothetical protein